MIATIIDGKRIAQDIKDEVARGVRELKEKRGITPGLAVAIVGEDPASQVYVRGKEKACQEVGIYSEKHALPESVSQGELLCLIAQLNRDNKIHGILVQLPLPGHIDEDRIIDAIDPKKDVDGFHPINVGNLFIGKPTFLPCTPHGIIELLKRSGVEIEGKNAVVVGRSNIVGKPVSILLLQENATVTMCHSRTADLGAETRRADILVAAVGRPEVIKADMVKGGVAVIDVGVNRVEGRLVGDVAFEEVSRKASAITPVPGGVGPMTIAMLMKNTLRAAQMERD
ncbi:MAG: bifunctional methylenetetrahydrofolate dehydrogenase/methenyltetrahydrofolate cyclohydrolase FolD [Actinomycetota bacterium]